VVSGIPIVAVTASVVEDKKADKKRSLFDAVLYKPLNKEALKEVLSSVIPVEKNADMKLEKKDHLLMFNKEVELASKEFFENIYAFRPVLEKARNRGNFGGLEQLLDELCDLSLKFDMNEFETMFDKIRSANKIFDIEESQKLITNVLSGIQILQETYHGKAV